MKKIVKNHISASLSKVENIFNMAAERLCALSVGQKIPATTLAKEIGEKVGIDGASLYPTLKILFEGYPNFQRKAGATGGMIRIAVDVDPEDNIVVTEVTEVKG